MPMPLVWSERPEPNAPGLRDCTYSSGLMTLVYGGLTSFPFGIYSVAEREALERSDDQPNETGASLIDLTTAVKRRYNLNLVAPPEALAVALTKTGRAYVLQGTPANLPAGHTLRRHDPSFTGGHAVCVVPIGWGYSLWLDPLAPNKYAGELVTNTTIIKWATGWGQMRMTLRDQFVAPVPPGPTQAELDAAKQALATAEARAAVAVADKEVALAALTTASKKIEAARAALA